MIKPPLVELEQKVDNKYTLVTLAAKRARQIVDGAPTYVAPMGDKPVTVALEEIAEGDVSYIRLDKGIK